MASILAIDASSEACSVALWRDGVIDESFEISPRSHTKRLLPMIDLLLNKHEITGTDLDAIAFAAGPGSFTGLRICLGVVQGLAFGWRCPVIPISTLQAMALTAQRTLSLSVGESILVALDARMSEVYAGFYRVESDAVSALSDDAVLAPSLVEATFLASKPTATITAIGPGWHYPDMPLIDGADARLEWYPHAQDVAVLAASAFAKGNAIDAMTAEPIYLRNTVSWKKREKKRVIAAEQSRNSE